MHTSIALLSLALLQAANAGAAPSQLSPRTTLPVVFTRGVDALHAHVGETVLAKTTQEIKLAGGIKVPAGAEVSGHVVESVPFAFDPTPYAKQRQSVLSIRFDTLRSGNLSLPLTVYVRAMADPVTSWDAQKPIPNADDSLKITSQIGGDLVNPSQDEVVSRSGDIVGYKRHGGIYAHLLSASNACDASDTEQAMGLYSASACGLYGFVGDELEQSGTTLVLSSRHQSPKIWKNSTALLEVLPDSASTASR